MPDSIIDQLRLSLGGYLPLLLGAIAILVVGLFLALAVKAGIIKALTALRVNERLNQQTQSPVNITQWIASAGFWLVLLVTLLAIFSTLRFDALYGPFSDLASLVLLYLPRIFLAFALGLVAWALAVALRAGINKAMSMTRLDDKLSEAAEVQPIGSVLGNVIYWLVLLLFLPAIVSALQIDGLTQPLTHLTAQLTAALPDIFAAGIIGFAGWLLAKVVRGLVTNLLAATGIDKLNTRLGLGQEVRLSKVLGMLAFIFIIIPTIIAALDALRIEAISDPAAGMLAQFMEAVPNIFAASLIVFLAWLVGKVVASLIARFLESVGFNQLPARLGMRSCAASDSPCQHNFKPSEFAGRLAWFFILLFATVEAANRLDFLGVRDLLTAFIDFGGNVLLGSAILIIGFWLANLASKAILHANAANLAGARVAKFAILALVLAMGLRAMGIADDIINLGFGLVLGAVAVATALAFGLGGREAAGKLAQRWVDQYLQNRKDE